MTEPSSSARVGPGIAAGRSVSSESGQDGAAERPYAAVLDWGRTHGRVQNLDSRAGPAAVDSEGHAPPNSVGKPGARTARRREASCMGVRRSLEGRA